MCNLHKLFTLFLVFLPIAITLLKVYYIITTKETQKQKAAGKPEKLNQRHPTKKLERMLYIIAKVKQNENYF